MASASCPTVLPTRVGTTPACPRSSPRRPDHPHPRGHNGGRPRPRRMAHRPPHARGDNARSGTVPTCTSGPPHSRGHNARILSVRPPAASTPTRVGTTAGRRRPRRTAYRPPHRRVGTTGAVSTLLARQRSTPPTRAGATSRGRGDASVAPPFGPPPTRAGTTNRRTKTRPPGLRAAHRCCHH
jgi:hypothetical protein